MTEDKCPLCGVKIKIIMSINGSQIIVNSNPKGVWLIDNVKNTGRYKHKSGYITHTSYCKAKDKYRTRG